MGNYNNFVEMSTGLKILATPPRSLRPLFEIGATAVVRNTFRLGNPCRLAQGILPVPYHGLKRNLFLRGALICQLK